jgi:curved DNA-binding protein
VARARAEPFGAEGLHARGEDHHAKILVDIEDVYRGASRQISLRVPKIDAEGRLLLETRTLNVHIPKGLRQGQLMRLAGQGGPGLGEGKAGDLLLEVHFKPHPRFHAEGADVTMTLPVAPWEAALGAVVALRLPDGASLNVRIPPGAQSGRQLRVRGKGIPSNPPGDLLLDVRVVLPPADTPRAKELYEAMARDIAFDPRAGLES